MFKETFPCPLSAEYFYDEYKGGVFVFLLLFVTEAKQSVRPSASFLFLP